MMSSPLIYDSTNLTTDARAELCTKLVGGKASNLIRLMESGSPIPAFYVISAEAFRQTVGSHPAAACDQDAANIAVRIRQQIADSSLAPDLRQAIESAHKASFPDREFVAVRSSSGSEDGSNHSFAGMHDSILGVRDTEALLAAVKQVWLSAVSPRAIAYRRLHGLPLIDTSMAVIVQRMVNVTRSGVCFTCDPCSGSRDRIVISSLLGVGEGLVSRGFPADSHHIDRQTFNVVSDVVEKREQLILDQESGGLKLADVSPHDRQRAALSDEQMVRVAKAALEVESMYAQPQDIEFCFSDDGSLFLLQTRPVTHLSQTSHGSYLSQEYQGDDSVSQRASMGNHVVWDNSNIIESYSGVTTPMTFSFIRRAYSIVYHCFAEVMGISPRVVHEHRDAFDNMLGLFHGRVYYNLKNWYRLVRMFPGYHYNRHFMESMMGVKESLSLEEQQAPVGPLRKWLVEFPSLLKLLSRTGWNFLRIRTIVDRFQQHFYRHYDQWSKIDFNEIPPHEMLRLHDMMEQKMLWNWKAPIINDFYVMIFYGMLRKMCGSWCGDENGTLQNGLICGEGGLQSDEPAKLLIRMTQLVKHDPALRELVLNEPVEDLPERIASDQRFGPFNQLMTKYLDEFGLRCANELKLESYSYQDQPHRLYQIIRSYLTAKDPSTCDLDAIGQRERKIRQTAEHQANEMLSKPRSWFPRRTLFRWVLKNARLGVRNRENMRFARTRIYGILRRMLRSIGQQFAEQGLLDDREDIFYLTIDEVWDFVKGTAVTTDLRGLANFRKAEYNAYRSETVPPPDDRFETYGTAYHGNQFSKRGTSHILESDNSLTGTGCCPGIVTGTVQLIRDPASDTYFQGDILAAQRTDPGWVPFFPAFSGILVERGSVLSHSAIVAREMGIPTIVGITGLTERLRSGQQIKMDGRTGTIQIVSDQ